MCQGYGGIQKMSTAGADGGSNELQQQRSFCIDSEPKHTVHLLLALVR